MMGIENVAFINRGKHAAEYSVCMGIQCQVRILVKFKFSNICELKTYDTS